jgi:pimeloyl-ACP methyl ester carboxylesterase
MNERPQILLVPSWSEVQWAIKPLLEEWADVASYDPPGVGAEPPAEGRIPEAIVARGAEEIERRGWTDCIVAGDDFGAVFATLVAAAERPRVAGLALGHACLEYRLEGPRPTMHAEIMNVGRRLLDVDFRAFIRQDVGVWDSRADYSAESADELVKELVNRVPREFALRLIDELESGIEEAGGSLAPFLRELGLPLLLAQHKDCVVFTQHGFDDFVAAFPDAPIVATPESPCLSAEFAAALHEFVDERAAIRRRPLDSPG